MPFTSSVFVGAPRADTRTGHGSIREVVRVDQGREDGAHLVEARTGVTTDPAQVSLVHDGRRLLLVSRATGALLYEASFPGRVSWDRMTVTRTGDRIRVRVPAVEHSPVRVRPRLRDSGTRSRLRALWDRLVEAARRALPPVAEPSTGSTGRHH